MQRSERDRMQNVGVPVCRLLPSAKTPSELSKAMPQPSPEAPSLAALILEKSFNARWLRTMAHRGGKGVVDNIDARALGRVADEIDGLRAELSRLRARKAERTWRPEEVRERCAQIVEEWVCSTGWLGSLAATIRALDLTAPQPSPADKEEA